jgi:exosortase
LWSHWATLVDLRGFWSRNDDYSAGQLVPLVAIYLVWRERAHLRARVARPSPWGLGLLALAELLRLGGVYYGFGSIERLALVAAIAGVVLLAAGRPVFWRLRWVLAFLLLMLPLPARLHEAIALPLQHLATHLAAITLELLGFFVVREGHILRLDAQTTVGVTEACSGLRMLTAFIFVSAVLAFLVRRPACQHSHRGTVQYHPQRRDGGVRLLRPEPRPQREVPRPGRLGHDAAGDCALIGAAQVPGVPCPG